MTPIPHSSPETKLRRALGPALARWIALTDALETAFGPLETQWKATKIPFGAVCVLRRKPRALVYLIPGAGEFEIVVVLGERAAHAALGSSLPDRIKELVRDARAYAEGRSVRWVVRAAADVPAIVELVHLKLGHG